MYLYYFHIINYQPWTREKMKKVYNGDDNYNYDEGYRQIVTRKAHSNLQLRRAKQIFKLRKFFQSALPKTSLC